MSNLTDEQRLCKYQEAYSYCSMGDEKLGLYKNSHVTADEYQLSRLRHVGLNKNGFIEKNFHFLFNKDGIPFEIAETTIGRGNAESSSEDEIESNTKILDCFKDIFFFLHITEKFPLNARHTVQRNLVKAKIDECFEHDDFSDILSIEHVYKDLFETLENRYFDEYIRWQACPAFFARDFMTKDEDLLEAEQAKQEEQESINM